MKTPAFSLKRSSLAMLLAAVLAPTLASGQSYTIANLGSLDPTGPVDASYANGLNGLGDVVGSSYVEMSLHAYLWTRQQGMQDLGTLGGDNSTAYSVNDFRTVVGQTQLANSDIHAFLWTKIGEMQDLGTLGGSESVAYGINNLGQVVGESYSTNSVVAHAFLWTQQNGMEDLGTLGGSTSTAYAINNRGEVVGTSSIEGDTNTHAFMWSKNKGMTDLGTIQSYNPSYAFGVNDLGQVVGYAGTTDLYTNTYGFLRNNGQTLTRLGCLDGGTQSFAYGINVSGEIIGSFNAASGAPHAFRWTLGKGMQDLNLLILPKSGWTLNQANAINNANEIAGSGPVYTDGGLVNHAFLLTPQ
jgi:probable HAF family extracellular repeat protein